MRSRPPRFYLDHPEVVFISHDASLTGAPLLMLTLLEWWLKSGGPSFRIVLRSGGLLEQRFRELGRVWNLDWPNQRTVPDGDEVYRLLSFCGPDVKLIYANTGAVGDVLEALDSLSVPILSHLHELEMMLTEKIGPERFGLVKERARGFVVPARSVSGNLTMNHSITCEQISIIPEYLPDNYGVTLSQNRKESGKPAVILGIGTTDWRKGPDLFVQVAARVRLQLSNLAFRFVWVGAQTSVGQIDKLRCKAKAAGVGDLVDFVGEQTDTEMFYRGAAVFVSSSREDPYPVVCLEAAAHGLPIVCFRGAGGISEFVRDDAGRVVPYLDVDSMADAVCELIVNPAASSTAGECGRKRVNLENRVSVCGPRLLDLAKAMMDLRLEASH